MQEIIPPGQPLPASREETLQLFAFLADLLDARFVLPGTSIRIGLTGLIGLVPVLGDCVSAFFSLYLLKLAREMGVARHVRLRMGLNIFIGWLIGLIPYAGDAFDIGWKANLRNLRLVRRALGL